MQRLFDRAFVRAAGDQPAWCGVPDYGPGKLLVASLASVDETPLSLKEAAERAGVTPATLRRWTRAGVVPHLSSDGGWTPAAVTQARMVARLRDRGHTLERIRSATDQGLLAFGRVEDLLPEAQGNRSLADAIEASGLEPALLERLWTSIGMPREALDNLTDDDVETFEHMASVLAAGLPLVALLQLARVYGQAMSQIADAEVRLFHLYVHEPLIREGMPEMQMAEEMESLAGSLIPRAAPLMEFLHQRHLRYNIAQDVVGHMEVDLDDEAQLGRLRVAIAFCDLAGYTRFTEEEGDEQALSYVERFVDTVTATLPESARVVKTIGDEVMIVAQDARTLAEWAVEFQQSFRTRPEPRIGMHFGAAVYRDGDYFGREVNLASRVVARARGGEVLITDSVAEHAGESGHLAFEDIGQVKLKGFDKPRQLSRVVLSSG